MGFLRRLILGETPERMATIKDAEERVAAAKAWRERQQARAERETCPPSPKDSTPVDPTPLGW